ncbi:hypothetical protein AB0K02_11260 [Streptomyces sp. NPDC049597]|uniref:hypothetical protein n=1 Tax=Streptomyces sp. NPDC049597 TaxID=3155276 RepID=UPI00342B72ED
MPPSTASVLPVMQDEAGDARKSTAVQFVLSAQPAERAAFCDGAHQQVLGHDRCHLAGEVAGRHGVDPDAPAARGLKHRIRWAHTRISTAADFLTAMREQGLLAGAPSTRSLVRDFVVSAARRGHSRPLPVPHRPKKDPVGLDEDSH